MLRRICFVVAAVVSSFGVSDATLQYANLQHFFTEERGDHSVCAGYQQSAYTDGCTLIVYPMSTVSFGWANDPCCIPGWTACGYWCASGACDLYWKAKNAQNIVGTACSAGVGACKRDGQMVCAQNGTGTVCSAVAGTPTPEVCDGIDNNCNGSVDEGFTTGGACSAGIGACKRNGQMVCAQNGTGTVCGATPGEPAAEVCDGVDNNCNEQTDDGFNIGEACSAGIGACSRDGIRTCSPDQSSSICSATPGEPTAEVCNDGKDNDCNFLTDEGCDKSCKDNQQVKSSVNMATGNLSHSQPVYRTLKAVLPLDLSLTYNSIEGDGPLGEGWTHSYHMSVSQGSDGGYIYTQASARKIALYPDGSYYKPLGFEYPVLTVNPNGTYTLKQDEDRVYNFNSSGKVTGIQDRFSNSITFTYTASNLTGISDSQGRTISLVYNTANRIETITDPNNNIHSFIYEGNNLINISTLTTNLETLTWAYSYTPLGQMQTKTTPMGYTITYVYENKRLAWVIDNDNQTRSLSFDPLTAASAISVGDDGQWIYTYGHATGKLATKRDPEGYTTTYVYGTNTETVTDAKGNITEYVYDSKQNLLSMTEKSATDPVGRTTSYTYNSANEILTMTDPENHVTTYTYTTDSGEKIVKVKDAANEETETRYYADGRIKHIKNSKNQTTTFAYNFDQTTKQTTETSTDFLGISTRRVYDFSGNMIESWDAFTTVTKYRYNSLNQLKTIKDHLDSVLNTYDYYADGNIKTATDANGNQTHYKYNYDGKITEVKDALGNTTTYVYGGGAGCPSCSGSKDELTSVTDANNKTTTYEYYRNGWKKNQKDPLNHVTSYTYDPTGFMTSLTDPAQAVTAFDKADLVMTKTDPLGKITTYVYDKAGRLHTKTDRKGALITYAYTPDNVLQAITYPDNSTVTFTNDELDRTTSMTDILGTTTYMYDDANRTVTVTDPHGFVVIYKNDEAGRLKELTYPGSKKVIYGYDKLNRMETVRLDWLNLTATYYYDSAGRLTSLTNFNGTVTTYGYDNANRLTSLENKKADDSVISSYSFPILDGVGNRKQAIINEPLAPVLTPEQTGYTYNEKKNRLLSANSDQQSAFSYDNEGQLSSINADTYTFDYEHRLKSVQQSAFSGQYFYDGKSNRLKAIRNDETTHYIHDLNNNVLAEADGNKNITKYYIHAQGLLGMVTSSNQVYSYHFNAIGSTVAITDQNQNVINAYAYNPFGVFLNQTETIPHPFKYVGQYGVMHEANGFYYMRARYYDPMVGRFISEDPLLQAFDGLMQMSSCGNKSSKNILSKFTELEPYVYTKNNPINKIDPTGLICGSGSTDAIVPDFYYAFDFTVPCQNHDDCYGACGSSFLVCNSLFLNDLLYECSKLTRNPLDQASCIMTAGIYYGFVSSPLGWSAYKRAQKEKCCK